MKSWHFTALAALLAVLLLALIAGGLYARGKRAEQFKNVQAQLETTEASAGISRETAEIMAGDQAEVWQHMQADEARINERIQANPRVDGPADPDILRVARDAHARAVCAASRVQREKCSTDPAAPAEQ